MLHIAKHVLAEGERYIGSIGSADGVTTHIILLPGETKASWEAAKEWAASIGGELPNRVEQALLFSTAKEEFKLDWYWSGEVDASDSGYAWCQDFSIGYQDDSGISSKLRARAVRRLIIQ